MPLPRLLLLLALLLCGSVICRPGSVAAGQAELDAIPGDRVIVRDSGQTVPSAVGLPAEPRRASSQLARSIIEVSYTGFPPEAEAAFQKAVDIWEAYVVSPVPIRVSATMEPLGAGVLGAAGPARHLRNFPGTPLPGVYYAAALADRLAGRDLDPATPDINASFNSDFEHWYFGLDGLPPPGKTDFVTVVLHELCHGIGFTDSMRYSHGSGNGGYGQGPAPPAPKIFDVFVANGAGERLVSSFPNGSKPFGEQLVSKGLWFTGPRASAGAGGRPPRLYAPAPFEDGSSVSHLDEDTYPGGDPNSLMTPELARSEVIHAPGTIALGILADMGWQLSDEVRIPLAPRAFIHAVGMVVREAVLP